MPLDLRNAVIVAALGWRVSIIDGMGYTRILQVDYSEFDDLAVEQLLTYAQLWEQKRAGNFTAVSELMAKAKRCEMRVSITCYNYVQDLINGVSHG